MREDDRSYCPHCLSEVNDSATVCPHCTSAMTPTTPSLIRSGVDPDAFDLEDVVRVVAWGAIFFAGYALIAFGLFNVDERLGSPYLIGFILSLGLAIKFRRKLPRI
jgi:hypothetical protein